MSGTKDFLRELASIPRNVVSDHGAERFAEGFAEAAAVAVEAVSEKIDALHEKVRSNQELSASEQKLLTGLSDLRVELEARLRSYWTEQLD